ncbi:unnamed protein product [Acanthoscelides obtectus]|uniref:Exosome complex component RRP45 n=1 Tax=Acanthoscelides obtectus TaxID=200917 RepID=A0A9P0PXA5_ACAOB|nr:unnamed protein product [Acanthoscelides obtectus]CAK1641613.1 Exosome complex component RRP45 [Acanthoscelides obtectus]
MSNIRKTIVSNCEKTFLLKNLAEFNRLDGRAFDEFRKVEIEFGSDWGCCFVSLGKTKVIAQVSCEIQQPKSSRPGEGILNLNVELNPIAAPHFEADRQSNEQVQLNRLLEKCLKDSKAIDLESLCIKNNEKVWAIRVDINVLNHEGNILDCASIAALAALAHFRRPDVTCDGEEFVIHSIKQKDPIPMVIHHYPVCITYSVFNSGLYILADPTLLEENVADAFLSIGLNAYKELCGLHLGGKADLSPEIIIQTANKAAARASSVVQQIKDAIEQNNEIRREQKDGFCRLANKRDPVELVEELSVYLDQWSTKKKKNKRKSKEPKDEQIEQEVKEPDITADIKPLVAGTAVLVPKENDDGDAIKVWDTSESEDDAVEFVELPHPKGSATSGITIGG